eukprot:1119808-Rhodomonas_salina.4
MSGSDIAHVFSLVSSSLLRAPGLLSSSLPPVALGRQFADPSCLRSRRHDGPPHGALRRHPRKSTRPVAVPSPDAPCLLCRTKSTLLPATYIARSVLPGGATSARKLQPARW